MCYRQLPGVSNKKKYGIIGSNAARENII